MLFRKSPTLVLGGDLPRHFLKAFLLRAKTVKAHKCIFGTFVAMDKSTYKHGKLSILLIFDKEFGF